ncbi:hypothetical protein C8Q74DRAFT_386384 [Fomes fomentarius]|nr:hypothetical protein C8Q74DRAFT_386384 [Fomes fomentarius]
MLVFMLSLAPFAANLVVLFVPSSGVEFANIGCVLEEEISSETNSKFLLIARISLIAADLLVILITWGSPMNREVLFNISKTKRWSLNTILLQNGTVYFIVLSCLNVCHLAFSLNGIFSADSDDVTSNLTIFTSPFTTILISRFLLDLQESYQRTVRVDSDHELNLGPDDRPLSFVARVVGSLGSDIQADEREVDDGEDLQSSGEAESDVQVLSEVENGGGISGHSDIQEVPRTPVSSGSR